MADEATSDDVIQAYLATADHFGIPVSRITRRHVREARTLGVHNVSERQIGSHGEAVRRARVARGEAESIPLDATPPGHYVKGVSTFVDGEGRTRGQWIKTARLHETPEEVLARLVRELPEHVPIRHGTVPGPAEPLESDLLAVYPMGDPHIGLLSWAPETGEDFDLEIARRIFCSAIDDLTGRGPRARTGLVINLGDFYHADNLEARTARSGHALDVDGRWPKVLRVGLEIMIHTIDRALGAHETVHVINAIGNHDDHSSMFLSVALQTYYRNEPRVFVDVSPSGFHYYKFGRCLIGVTHGHMVKGDSLEAIMASDRPREWGDTDHRFWYCGHVHHTSRKELRGCTVETFRTLAAKDAWHAAKGYRSGRDMNRITLHRQWGEIGRETVSAAYLEARYLEASLEASC